jgi:hypothetical protein
MTEEEKSAIGYLYMYADDMENKVYDCETTVNIKKVLKLVHKQKEEIEQLANGIRVLGTNPDITTEEIIKEFTEKPITEEYMEEFKSRYISKDKIREVLPKINGSISHFKSKNDNHIVKRIKRMLEELLEE